MYIYIYIYIYSYICIYIYIYIYNYHCMIIYIYIIYIYIYNIYIYIYIYKYVNMGHKIPGGGEAFHETASTLVAADFVNLLVVTEGTVPPPLRKILTYA